MTFSMPSAARYRSLSAAAASPPLLPQPMPIRPAPAMSTEAGTLRMRLISLG